MIWMIVMQIIYVQKQQIKLHGAKGQIVRIFTFQLFQTAGRNEGFVWFLDFLFVGCMFNIDFLV